FAAVHHFLRVRVRGAQASLDAIGVGGEILETVRLDDGKPSDPAPPTPVPWRDEVTQLAVAPDGLATTSPPSVTPAIRALVLGVFVAILVGWIAAALIARRRRARSGRARRG